MRQTSKPKGRMSRQPRLQEFGYHLVYAEGSKSEPHYVEDIYLNIPKEYRSSKIVIETVPQSGGRNTIDLVKFAENDVKQKMTTRRIDHVWIFYDKDSFPRDRFDNTYHKIEGKNAHEYKTLNYDEEPCDKQGTRWHAVWSNECFELWLLLHFENIESALSR